MKRIFAISDIHFECTKNKDLFVDTILNKNSRDDFSNDTIIIAGDISHNINEIEFAFDLFSSCFKYVFFTFGNHDLWLIKGKGCLNYPETSIEKIKLIEEIAKRKGNVFTKPKRIYEKIVIYPIITWYDLEFRQKISDFNKYMDLLKNFVVDYQLCKFKEGLTWKTFKNGVSEYLLNNLNDDFKINKDDYVITMTHFLPRNELIPPPELLRHTRLHHVVGSKEIDKYIRGKKSKIHCFGHSHINVDKVIDGVRYVQNHFGLPKRSIQYRLEILKYPILMIDKDGKITTKKLRNALYTPSSDEW